MRRFLLFSAVLFLLTSALIFIGRGQPLAGLFPELGTCNGMPCYEGIELLKTSREEARTILNQLPGSYWNGATNRMTFSSDAVDWVELFSDSKDRIFGITLHLRAGTLSLGAVIQ